MLTTEKKIEKHFMSYHGWYSFSQYFKKYQNIFSRAITHLLTVLGIFFCSQSYAIKPNAMTVDRQAVPVKITVANQYWVTTFSICNTTSNDIPLTDIELSFNYNEKMPTNIWGNPWAAWRVASQNNGNVVLLGGANYTLTPDPDCNTPLTVSFNAAPDIALPTGPFVFKSTGGGGTTTFGNLKITMQAAPANNVSQPSVTVSGPAMNNKTMAWGETWSLNQIPTGTYTISAGDVTDNTNRYQSTPISVNVLSNTTVNATVDNYKLVGGGGGNPASWASIKHVVVIMLENTDAANALKQPYMKSLTSKGAYVADMHALTHPSQPNYIGFVAGSMLGVTGNSNVDVDARHIGNLLNDKGLTWKAYAENLPNTPCYTGKSSGKYARRHEPFISFKNVQSNPTQCANIVNATAFFNDLSANNLPTFSFYIPNNDNNGHDTGVKFADTWLSNTFGPIFNNSKYTQDTLFVVTFDEDEGSSANIIYTAFVGAGVKPAATASSKYTLYSLLRTIEDIFQLGTLGKSDASTSYIAGIWQ